MSMTRKGNSSLDTNHILQSVQTSFFVYINKFAGMYIYIYMLIYSSSYNRELVSFELSEI